MLPHNFQLQCVSAHVIIRISRKRKWGNNGNKHVYDFNVYCIGKVATKQTHFVSLISWQMYKKQNVVLGGLEARSLEDTRVVGSECVLVETHVTCSLNHSYFHCCLLATFIAPPNLSLNIELTEIVLYLSYIFSVTRESVPNKIDLTSFLGWLTRESHTHRLYFFPIL